MLIFPYTKNSKSLNLFRKLFLILVDFKKNMLIKYTYFYNYKYLKLWKEKTSKQWKLNVEGQKSKKT